MRRLMIRLPLLFILSAVPGCGGGSGTTTDLAAGGDVVDVPEAADDTAPADAVISDMPNTDTESPDPGNDPDVANADVPCSAQAGCGCVSAVGECQDDVFVHCGPDGQLVKQYCETLSYVCGIDPDTQSPACVPPPCVPQCAGKACGPDGCGGTCAPGCTAPAVCSADGTCLPNGCTSDCGETVVVAGGPFPQGCDDSVDEMCFAYETPLHTVVVPVFAIDKYEVTRSLYGRCVDAGVCSEPAQATSPYTKDCNWKVAGKDDHPVNCIDWSQARTFCAWAGKRLCSESEWEKAARGTDGRRYPWGDETPTTDLAAISASWEAAQSSDTLPVGSKPLGASPCGAMDLCGNVGEWLEDDYHDGYGDAPSDGSAWIDEPRSGMRGFRGGSYLDFDPVYMRMSYRNGIPPSETIASLGVRCCRSE